MKDLADLHKQADELAASIRTIDVELDKMDREREVSIAKGMRFPDLAVVGIRLAQDREDQRYELLLTERRTLVEQLKPVVARIQFLERT